MSLLHGRLELHGVTDVEALMSRAIQRSGTIANLRPPLRPHERDDLLAHLVAFAWQLSLDFDPDPSRGRVSFSTFVYNTAQKRIIDFVRSTRGRTRWQFSGHVYERPPSTLVSFDDERAGLVESLASGSGDPAHGGDAGLAGLFAGGDSQRARDLELLGLEPPRRAA